MGVCTQIEGQHGDRDQSFSFLLYVILLCKGNVVFFF